MQTEVDEGDALAVERHLDALRFPVAECILVACDVDVVGEISAVQFDMDGTGLLTDIAYQILGTENDVVVKGCRQAGHEAVVMVIAGEGVY